MFASSAGGVQEERSSYTDTCFVLSLVKGSRVQRARALVNVKHTEREGLAGRRRLLHQSTNDPGADSPALPWPRPRCNACPGDDFGARWSS
jgi:hypothetical protein